MSRILFVGDVCVDMIMGGLKSLPIANKEITSETFNICMGSSAVISACAYASLGGNASCMGLVGKDEFGKFMLRGLEEFGIESKHIEQSCTINTGITVVLVNKNTRTQITYPGTIEEFEGNKLIEETIKDFSHIHFSGIYQQRKFKKRLLPILELAKELKVSTSLDPQWDSSEEWDEMDKWLPLLTFFFANEDEAISIARSNSIEEASRVLGNRTECPIIKIGEKGALCRSRNKAIYVPGFRVKVIDTTGAGDSFVAGFLYSFIEQEENLVESIKFANAVGARCCSFIGGTTPRTTRDDVVEMMKYESHLL